MPQGPINRLPEQRTHAYREALSKTYCGCMFDIDGTLTTHGRNRVAHHLRPLLAELCFSVPVAISTGRGLESALSVMEEVFETAAEPDLCRERWSLICENGCVGYTYSSRSRSYSEFFRIPYPYTQSHRARVFDELSASMEGELAAARLHQVSTIFVPPGTGAASGNIREASRNLHRIALETLRALDPRDQLTVADAGLAITVFPSAGNKENGTQEFVKLLSQRDGIPGFGADRIVVVGDQPGPQGNDESFLDGRFGAPFTVGGVHPENLLPLPVYDPRTGEVQTGPEATASLLRQLRFSNLF